MNDIKIKEYLDIAYPYGKEIYEILEDVIVIIGSHTHKTNSGIGTSVIPKGTLCHIRQSNDGQVWYEWDFEVNCKNNLCEKQRGKAYKLVEKKYLGRMTDILNICELKYCIFKCNK